MGRSRRTPETAIVEERHGFFEISPRNFYIGERQLNANRLLEVLPKGYLMKDEVNRTCAQNI